MPQSATRSGPGGRDVDPQNTSSNNPPPRARIFVHIRHRWVPDHLERVFRCVRSGVSLDESDIPGAVECSGCRSELPFDLAGFPHGWRATAAAGLHWDSRLEALFQRLDVLWAQEAAKVARGGAA